MPGKNNKKPTFLYWEEGESIRRRHRRGNLRELDQDISNQRSNVELQLAHARTAPRARAAPNPSAPGLVRSSSATTVSGPARAPVAFDIGGGGDEWMHGLEDEMFSGESEPVAFSDWHDLIPSLLKAYNRATSLTDFAQTPRVIHCRCFDAAGPGFVDVHIYTMGGRITSRFACCYRHMASTLFCHSLFPASPVQPQAAFQLSFLRWLEALRKTSSVGVYNFALAARDIYDDDILPIQIMDHFRKQIRSASSWFSTMRAYGQQAALYGTTPWMEARPMLNEDNLKLNPSFLADTCPACFQQFMAPSESQSSGPQLILSVDGNFTQKRKRRDDVYLRQSLPPRRFLSLQQVQVAERLMGSTANLNTASADIVHFCTAQFKAADPLAPKASVGNHDVTGVMGLCCRHDIPVVFCDITTAGERHFYAIALLNAVLEALPRLRHIAVMYDIGCKFADNAKVANALVPNVTITWTIPLFHVYGHISSCHICYSPRHTLGCAWSDGEGMERVWAGISGLIASTRAMSQVERRLALEDQLQHVALDRRRSLFQWIQRKQARISLLKNEHLQLLRGVTLADMLHYYRTIGSPTDLIPSSPIPPHFPDFDSNLFNLLSYMCLLRQENARAKVVKPKVSSRSRPRPLAAATTTDPPPAFDQTTALLASALHKSIAKVNLTQAQLRDRIGTRYERSLRERLLISLGTDKKRAFVDMADFNTYQATIRSTFRPLVEATLFDTHTSSWISFVASYGTVSLPWWSSVDVGRILDAFDRSRRLAEETALLHFEQTQMQTWLHARIEEVKARAPHFPQQLALRQLEALKTRWESPFPPDDTLLQAFEQIDISAAEEDNPGAPLTEQDHVSIFL